MGVKPETSQDKEALSREAAAAQGTVHGQKGGILGWHPDLNVSKASRFALEFGRFEENIRAFAEASSALRSDAGLG